MLVLCLKRLICWIDAADEESHSPIDEEGRIYQQALGHVDERIQRVQGEMERVREQLAEERKVIDLAR